MPRLFYSHATYKDNYNCNKVDALLCVLTDNHSEERSFFTPGVSWPYFFPINSETIKEDGIEHLTERYLFNITNFKFLNKIYCRCINVLSG